MFFIELGFVLPGIIIFIFYFIWYKKKKALKVQKIASEFIKEVERRELIPPVVYKFTSASTANLTNIKIKDQDEKEVLNFGSNNYLGLGSDERIKNEVSETALKYGCGSGGSRFATGNTDIQLELEKRIAKFKGFEACLTYVTGYMANTGAIPALLKSTPFSIIQYAFSKKKSAIVFSDELNHSSIIEGICISKAKKVIYNHNDMEDLENKLNKHAAYYERRMIISDGVFSLEGDICDLKKILEFGKKHHCIVYIDDAHGTGVLGKSGKGVIEHFGIDPKKHQNLIIMGTFTKSFGGLGGFICSTKEIVRYLTLTSRSYIFTAPIPPAIVGGIIKALDLIESNDNGRIDRLKENRNYFVENIKKAHFNVLDAEKYETSIIPLILGEPSIVYRFYKKLLYDYSIYTLPIIYPGVPKNQGRLRIIINSEHTKDQMDQLITSLKEIRKKNMFNQLEEKLKS